MPPKSINNERPIRKIHLHFEEADGGLKCAVLDADRELPIAAMTLRLEFDSSKGSIEGKMRWFRLVDNQDGCIESPKPDYYVNNEGHFETVAGEVKLSRVTSTDVEVSNRIGSLVRNLCKTGGTDRVDVRAFDMSGD